MLDKLSHTYHEWELLYCVSICSLDAGGFCDTKKSALVHFSAVSSSVNLSSPIPLSRRLKFWCVCGSNSFSLPAFLVEVFASRNPIYEVKFI